MNREITLGQQFKNADPYWVAQSSKELRLRSV